MQNRAQERENLRNQQKESEVQTKARLIIV